MTLVTAQLNDYRQSPRKVRVVANLVRGKSVEFALTTLRFTTKRSSDPLYKLIESAVANAKAQNLDTDTLTVKEIRVDGGKTLFRRRSASRGRAPAIKKRTSHVQIVLSTEEVIKKGKAVKAKAKK